MSNKTVYDCIIIGAGPSGLLAGYILNNNSKKILIIDQGKELSLRKHSKPEDVSTGIGGAGLFSDGKLSYYPSGTKLWDMYCNMNISYSYSLLSSLLKKCNIDLKPLSFSNQYNDNSSEKKYDSDYISLDSRKNLINYLITKIGTDNIKINSLVRSITANKISETYSIRIENSNQKFIAKNIILALGKYGATYINKLAPFVQTKFSKSEIGIRLEMKKDIFPFKDSMQTDIKLIKSLDNCTQFRTFCCCKNGGVIKSTYDKYVSYNGCQEINPNTISSIGINLRTTSKYSTIFEEIQKYLKGKITSFNIPLPDYLNSSKKYYGKQTDKLFKDFINNLEIPIKDYDDISIYGPVMEYNGNSPVLEDKSLKVVNENIWITGDLTGLFRGLLPALLSGILAALHMLNEIKAPQEVIKDYRISQSSTKNMRTIFTAQSKMHFYCRDAICEYVFKNKCLPINPFRIFDYFLNDRVDRNIIRRSNNKLISLSDELWVFGPISNGVLFEIVLAQYYNMPIRYFSIGTRYEDFKELTKNEIKFEPEVHKNHVKRDALLELITSQNQSFLNQISFDYDC